LALRAIGLLDLVGRCAALHAQHVVEIAFRHSGPPFPERPRPGVAGRGPAVARLTCACVVEILEVGIDDILVDAARLVLAVAPLGLGGSACAL
jgi:hypothetical protein